MSSLRITPALRGANRYAEVFFMPSVFSHLLKKFPDSLHSLRRTQTLTTVGLFLAIHMVLSYYVVIQLKDRLKI